jgi:hypothetical protein
MGNEELEGWRLVNFMIVVRQGDDESSYLAR